MGFHNDDFERKGILMLNIWTGNIGDCLIGLCYFPNRLTGDVYCNFLSHELSELIDALPLRTRDLM